MSRPLFNVEIIRTHLMGRKPDRATAGSAGYDLWLPDVPIKQFITEFVADGPERLESGELRTTDLGLVVPRSPILIRLGFKIWIEDPGYEAQIRLRSGIGKKGLVIPNAPGTIDSDYQGEIAVLLMATSDRLVEIRPGDRVAQMVFCPVARPEFREVCVFSDKTDRGEGGFGSTGG